jgi:hypothetical protein
MRRQLLVAALLAPFCIVGSAAARIDRDLVPDSATAIRVGGAILETYMGKNRFAAMIRRAPLRADLDGDLWSVYAYPAKAARLVSHSNGLTTMTVTTGWGQPVVELSKHDAQVKDIYFAR